MFRCLACEVEIPGPSWTCPSCGFAPRREIGYLAFVSEHSEDGFEASFFPRLAALEAGYWWFEARNEMIDWALAKWCPGARSFLEIGCGTGFVVANVARRFPALQVSACELFSEGLSFVSERIPQAQLYQIDARHLPFTNEFDVVGAFDVVEHIDEDERVFSEIHRALTPGGAAVITVPQHPFLWSKFDEYGHHKRRYTRGELQSKLAAAGFEVLALRSFVSLLLPLQLMTRLLPSSKEAYDVEAEFRIAPFLNKSLRNVMKFESVLVRSGISFPFGGSLLAVARPRG